MLIEHYEYIIDEYLNVVHEIKIRQEVLFGSIIYKYMLKDIKITKAIQNERNELVVSFLVKREDYNDVDAELLKQAKITGNMIDIEFMGLRVVDGQEERSKKLQMLGGLMSSYAEKSHLKLDSLL